MKFSGGVVPYVEYINKELALPDHSKLLSFNVSCAVEQHFTKLYPRLPEKKYFPTLIGTEAKRRKDCWF